MGQWLGRLLICFQILGRHLAQHLVSISIPLVCIGDELCRQLLIPFPWPWKKADGYFSVFGEGVLDALDESFTRFHLSTQLGFSQKTQIFLTVFVEMPASKFNEPLRRRYRLLLCCGIKACLADFWHQRLRSGRTLAGLPSTM